jgi:sensor histidine kinase YesM
MKTNWLQKGWWIIAIFLFDVCYYYFVRYLIERNEAGFVAIFRLDAILFLFSISLFSVYCISLSRKLLSRFFSRSIQRRYLLVMFSGMIFFIFVVFTVQYGLEMSAGQERPLSYYVNNVILMGFLHLIVGNAAAGVMYFRESNQLRAEIMDAAKRQSEMELHILRQQMNPHFLFNNLNTLSSLITLDQEAAIEFTQKLSALYRYSTKVSREEVVPVKDEVNFAIDYFRLTELRFGKVYQLKVEFELSGLNDHVVIPMSMQNLIENVVKHNAASEEHPLEIRMWLAGEQLFISNPKRLKGDDSSGLGTGLRNLQKQFSSVIGKPMEITNTQEVFTVGIPLTKAVKQ